MFETLNEFKLKSCQLQSFITFQDLQLLFWKFFHPKLFTKFEVHFAVCQIWATRVRWSGTHQTFFLFFCFLLFLFFLFPSSFILPNWLPCTLNILIKFTQLYIFNSSTHIIALSYAVIDQNSIYINSIIALDTLKLSSGSKKLPKFYTK